MSSHTHTICLQPSTHTGNHRRHDCADAVPEPNKENEPPAYRIPAGTRDAIVRALCLCACENLRCEEERGRKEKVIVNVCVYVCVY